MYVNELLAIARQNELHEQGDQFRLARQARGDRRGLVRRLSGARKQIRSLTAPSGEPARPEGPRRGTPALR